MARSQVSTRFSAGSKNDPTSPMSRKAVISTAKTITDMINSFLNEMEIALLQDVTDFLKKEWITQEVFDAFVNRDMTKLDNLYKEDLEATRIMQLTEQAEIRSGLAGKNKPKGITKWVGTNFKKLLTNSDFTHAEAVTKKIPPVLILGSPGIGKSDIIRSIAKARKYGKEGMIDIRLSQKESIDLRGFPVPNDATRSVDWFISSEWPRNPLSRGILFFDELTSASKSVQVAAYEIVLDRKLGDIQYGGYELPPGWLICAAGNLKDDDAAVEEISSALANRMMHLILEVDVNAWIDWAIKNDVHPAIISYMQSNLTFHGLPARWKLHCLNAANGTTVAGKLLPVVDRERGWPSPRSWTRVSNILHGYELAKSLVGNKNLSELETIYANILDRSQLERMLSTSSPYLNQDTLEDMVVGLVGFDIGLDFLNFYFSYMHSVNLATEIAMSGMTSGNYSQINNVVEYPIWTKDAVTKRTKSFYKIQDIRLPSLNNITISELIDKLNRAFNGVKLDSVSITSEQIDEAVEQLKDLIGGDPLAFLSAMPNVITSDGFYRAVANRINKELPNIDLPSWQDIYRFCIRNLVEVCSLLDTNLQLYSRILINDMFSYATKARASSASTSNATRGLKTSISNPQDRAYKDLSALEESLNYDIGISGTKPKKISNLVSNLSLNNQNTNASYSPTVNLKSNTNSTANSGNVKPKDSKNRGLKKALQTLRHDSDVEDT